MDKRTSDLESEIECRIADIKVTSAISAVVEKDDHKDIGPLQTENNIQEFKPSKRVPKRLKPERIAFLQDTNDSIRGDRPVPDPLSDQSKQPFTGPTRIEGEAVHRVRELSSRTPQQDPSRGKSIADAERTEFPTPAKDFNFKVKQPSSDFPPLMIHDTISPIEGDVAAPDVLFTDRASSSFAGDTDLDSPGQDDIPRPDSIPLPPSSDTNVHVSEYLTITTTHAEPADMQTAFESAVVPPRAAHAEASGGVDMLENFDLSALDISLTKFPGFTVSKKVRRQPTQQSPQKTPKWLQDNVALSTRIHQVTLHIALMRCKVLAFTDMNQENEYICNNIRSVIKDVILPGARKLDHPGLQKGSLYWLGRAEACKGSWEEASLAFEEASGIESGEDDIKCRDLNDWLESSRRNSLSIAETGQIGSLGCRSNPGSTSVQFTEEELAYITREPEALAVTKKVIQNMALVLVAKKRKEARDLASETKRKDKITK